MPTLTLKNVPEELHRRLKARAERNHRSLNREAIRLLEAAVATPQASVRDEAWEQAQALRARLAEEGVWITAEEVHTAIDEGRA
jgi:plasmid stability protein